MPTHASPGIALDPFINGEGSIPWDLWRAPIHAGPLCTLSDQTLFPNARHNHLDNQPFRRTTRQRPAIQPTSGSNARVPVWNPALNIRFAVVDISLESTVGLHLLDGIKTIVILSLKCGSGSEYEYAT
jgi:hypothetical protein